MQIKDVLKKIEPFYYKADVLRLVVKQNGNIVDVMEAPMDSFVTGSGNVSMTFRKWFNARNFDDKTIDVEKVEISDVEIPADLVA